MVTHTVIATLGTLRLEACELDFSLGYIVRLYLRNERDGKRLEEKVIPKQRQG